MRQISYVLGLFIFLTLPSFSCNSQSQESMRHEFIKCGKHASEMALGNYVILNISKSETSAKQTAEEIQKSGYKEAGYGYLSNKESWYIYIKSANDSDIKEVTTIRDKYHKIERFKDAWLLTVFE